MDDDPLDLARVIAQHLGLVPRRVTPVVGGGSVNHVLVVETVAGRVVVRFSIDPVRDELAVEEWCLRRAREHGIASPEVVARGSLDGHGYLVTTYVDGQPGTAVDPDLAWHVLAELARAVPASSWVPTRRTDCSPGSGATWRAHGARTWLTTFASSDPAIRSSTWGSTGAPTRPS